MSNQAAVSDDLSNAAATGSAVAKVAFPESTTDQSGEEQRYRAVFYSLLASILRQAPDQSLLDDIKQLATVEPESGELTVAMSMLGLAAGSSQPTAVDDEFHALFIGVGRGELVPYGSWYQTGFLMEKPLGHLRDDLARLGFQREEDVHEPEDHIAALCEVMMMMIEDGVAMDQQAAFYQSHMASWAERFFSDLSEARAAVFYRAVGRFGQAFAELERRYLEMKV